MTRRPGQGPGTTRPARSADGYTWRAIAASADDAWGTDSRGNQLFGENLCLESAQLLGDDPNADPWN
ncbi:hypothetical protein ABZU53_25535 [Micromonospora sp. NPDC005194]|uniref:hypothetical protein n=1 Tax=Micromonospora sp. NPDC005194 TaxID=3156870 RepID=UPI0033B45E5D